MTARPEHAPRRGADPVDQHRLLGLVGYNCRRAYLRILSVFLERMGPMRLRPVEYSVLAILRDNRDVTQKRLAIALDVSPPNLAVLLDRLQERGLVVRVRNPDDGRSQMLQLTADGRELARRAAGIVAALEIDATSALTERERAELIRLLQKVFLGSR